MSEEVKVEVEAEHGRCRTCETPFESRVDSLQRHCRVCCSISKVDMLAHTIDCRECGAANLERHKNCDLCGATLLKHLIHQNGYIQCHKCEEVQVKPDFFNAQTCSKCKAKLWTKRDDRDISFFVGQSVYFVSHAGFVKPGIVVGIESAGTSVRVRHAERDWSDEAYNEVHAVGEVAPTLKGCCELMGKRSRRRPLPMAEPAAPQVKTDAKRPRTEPKTNTYHWLTHGVPSQKLELSEDEAKFAEKIGSQFRDTEEPSQPVFDIVDIVRRMEDSVLFFAYIPFDIFADDENAPKPEPEDDKYEYTECEELLAASWAEWL